MARNCLADRLFTYLEHNRPQLPGSEWACPNLNGRQFDPLSWSIISLGAKYQLKLPTSTDGRHAAAIAAALTLPEMYYRDIHSVGTAQQGLAALEELRKGQGERQLLWGASRVFQVYGRGNRDSCCLLQQLH